jgi:hypothetical protein
MVHTGQKTVQPQQRYRQYSTDSRRENIEELKRFQNSENKQILVYAKHINCSWNLVSLLEVYNAEIVMLLDLQRRWRSRRGGGHLIRVDVIQRSGRKSTEETLSLRYGTTICIYTYAEEVPVNYAGCGFEASFDQLPVSVCHDSAHVIRQNSRSAS